MRISIFFLTLIFQGLLLAQNPQIQQLQQEVLNSEGLVLLEKGIQLSDAHFEAKHFERATEIAHKTYEEAQKQENYEYMAIALNREGQAIIRNPRTRPLDKLAAFEKFQTSLELLETHNIDNTSLRKDDIDHLKRAGRHIASAKTWKETGELLDFALDTVMQAMELKGKEGVKEIFIPKLAPPSGEFVGGPQQQKKERRQEIYQQLMDLKMLQFEKDLRDKHIAEIPDSAEIEAIVQNATAEAKKLWPVEKQKFESELDQERTKIERMNAEDMKEELLLAQYKNRYDSLMYLHTVDSIDLAKKTAQLKQQEAEAKQQKSRHSMWVVGSGSTFVLSFVLFLGFRQQKKSNRLLTHKNGEIKKEQERSEELLLNILPAEVAEELKQYGAAQAHRYDSVTVLFSDFKNFSRIAEKLSPERLVAELDYCFKAFDSIIEKHKLEKIKTIGDAYMCAGGLPSPSREHAVRAVQVALEMQEFLENWKAEKMANSEPFFEARIGIHTGPIVAGVVGVKKFAYDIWGDTVNIASRMESGGEPGKVNISGSTYEMVKDNFHFTYRGKIKAKNKGEIDMYFVEG